MQRILTLVVGMGQTDTLHLARGFEHKIWVVAWDEFHITIIKLHTSRVFDKRFDLGVLVELSSSARLDGA